MDEFKQCLLRQLPSVDELLNDKKIIEELENLPKQLITETVRNILKESRNKIISNKIQEFDKESLVQKIIAKVTDINEGNLREVINATGVILHTNLGRALLSKRAQEAVERISKSYSNLELNLETGNRGSRYSHVEELLTNLTGAEAALVVNNNAGAVLLTLSALAKGKEVIVSRGQLVEIGGAFRVPDVMIQSGALLVEVGTTNKTYITDYEKAIGENTSLIMKIHTSNYKVVGFTHETTLEEMVTLGKTKGIPVIEDLGSGFLVNLREYGIGDEPTVVECIKAGADVVTFSGDKLLGGPQAGIIVGKSEFIEIMKKHPLTRALRVDKFTVAALEATLLEYLDPVKVAKNIPTLNMLTISREKLKEKAEGIKKALSDSDLGIITEVIEDFSQVGGGAMPTTELPTLVVKLKSFHLSAGNLAEKLRQGKPAIMVRVKDDHIIIDPRTIQDNEILKVIETVKNSLLKQGVKAT